MGNEVVSPVPAGSYDYSFRKRDRGDADIDISSYGYTCGECSVVRWSETVNEGIIDRCAPERCAMCRKEKYSGITRKKLLEEIPARVTGLVSMHLATLGEAQYSQWQDNRNVITPAEDLPEYWTLREEMKSTYRKLLRSKWWRNRVDACFYTIEVKTTLEAKTSGTDSSPITHVRWKLHPHVHALVQHAGYHDFKQQWQKYFNRSPEEPEVVYGVKRVRGSSKEALARPIGYIMKYAMKDYGNPSLKGRYYERTGSFRTSAAPTGREQ